MTIKLDPKIAARPLPADVADVGGDLEWLPMRAAGVSLVVRDVTLSGA